MPPLTEGVIPIAPFIHGQPYITPLSFVQPDDKLDHGLIWLKKPKLSKKEQKSVGSVRCTALPCKSGKRKCNHTYLQLPIYIAVKQPWNCVSQAVVLGGGREKPCWLFDLEIRAPLFTSLGVSKLNQEGVKKHWTCMRKFFALQ